MDTRSYLQTLLNDGYTVINELQISADMTQVKRELLMKGNCTKNRLKELSEFFHEMINSFEARSEALVDSITTCKMSTLDSHSNELIQCLEYLSKMCVITEDLLKLNDACSSNQESFASKLQQELSNGLRDCKELHLIDYDMFTSLDVQIDIDWLFKSPFVTIISKSPQNNLESKLCSIGFEDIRIPKAEMSSSNKQILEHESPPFAAQTSRDRAMICTNSLSSTRNILTVIPERQEESLVDNSEELTLNKLDGSEQKVKVEAMDMLKVGATNFIDKHQEIGIGDSAVSSFCKTEIEEFRQGAGVAGNISTLSKFPAAIEKSCYKNTMLKAQEEKTNNLQTLAEETNFSFTSEASEQVTLPPRNQDEAHICDALNRSCIRDRDIAAFPESPIQNGIGQLEAAQTVTEQVQLLTLDKVSPKQSNGREVETTSSNSVFHPKYKLVNGPEDNTTLSQAKELSSTVETLSNDKSCIKGVLKSSQMVDNMQSKNKKIGNTTLSDVNEVKHKEITESANVKKSQTQDTKKSLTLINEPKPHVYGSHKTEILSGRGRPVEMHFSIETAISWNRYGAAEINAVFVEKITGGLFTSFDFPIGCCLLTDGHLVVADTGNNLVKILHGNELKRTIGKSDGIKFIRPSAVTSDTEDNIYVKDDLCVQIFSCDGKLLKSLGAKVFKHPYGIFLTDIPKYGPTLFVLDTGHSNSRLHRYLVREDRLQSCVYEPLFHCGTSASKFRFFAIHENMMLASDLGASSMYFSDIDGHMIKRFGSNGHHPGNFVEPSGVVADAKGNWLIGDSKNNRVQVFDNRGNFIAIINFTSPIRRPSGLHLSSDGTLYVINFLDHCIKVYRLEKR